MPEKENNLKKSDCRRLKIVRGLLGFFGIIVIVVSEIPLYVNLGVTTWLAVGFLTLGCCCLALACFASDRKVLALMFTQRRNL
jgi:uncharacterized membrane protein HdeD (DUF308 family)